MSMLAQFFSNKFSWLPLLLRGQGYSAVDYSWFSSFIRWHTHALVFYSTSVGESHNYSAYQSTWSWLLLIWSLNFNKYFHKCRLEPLNLSHQSDESVIKKTQNPQKYVTVYSVYNWVYNLFTQWWTTKSLNILTVWKWYNIVIILLWVDLGWLSGAYQASLSLSPPSTRQG